MSTDITQEDKDLIFNTCKEISNKRIIITYGTAAMTEIGQILKEIKNKTIVITGALKSQLIKETDAEFNVGFAVASVQTLKPGIYIAMRGRVYSWNKCHKDMVTGQFVENL